MDALLAPDEGSAVEVREGNGPFLVACEHASNRIPRVLGTLGLNSPDLERHIAWDPGATKLAGGLARTLDGTLVLQRFSRLVIDCNRDPAVADAITEFSEDTEVPGNKGLTEEQRTARIAALWTPFHNAIEKLIDGRRNARRPTALITVHSFTPIYRGVKRPWHVGIISTSDRSFVEPMLAALGRDAALTVGDNQPYSARDNVDYTIRRHGRDRGLPHAMIEVRNDLLQSERDVAEWVERLADAIQESTAAIGFVPAKTGT